MNDVNMIANIDDAVVSYAPIPISNQIGVKTIPPPIPKSPPKYPAINEL